MDIMEKRPKKYTTDELREYIYAAQGQFCLMPECNNLWVDLAHIEDSGMGGRDNRTPSNLVGLCRVCHQDYDQNRRRVPRELMRARKAELLSLSDLFGGTE